MQSRDVDHKGTDLTFPRARALAKRLAKENRMQDPAIICWNPRSTDARSPSCAGDSPGCWWEKYGEGNGDRLEISVGGELDFVMMESRGYDGGSAADSQAGGLPGSGIRLLHFDA